MSALFKVVLVIGARQTGKTTILRHLAKAQNKIYVTLENMLTHNFAKTDSTLFFQTYKLPIIIDEVQYAPELFSRIKIICNEQMRQGYFG